MPPAARVRRSLDARSVIAFWILPRLHPTSYLTSYEVRDSTFCSECARRRIRAAVSG
jgi:hypothetical protein